jgi:hypothetical protein
VSHHIQLQVDWDRALILVPWVTDMAMGTVRTIMILRDLHKWATLIALVG